MSGSKYRFDRMHFKNRMAQRFGVVLSTAQTKEIVEAIKNNRTQAAGFKLQFLKKTSNSRSLWLMSNDTHKIICVYSNSTHQVVTALPEDAAEMSLIEE